MTGDDPSIDDVEGRHAHAGAGRASGDGGGSHHRDVGQDSYLRDDAVGNYALGEAAEGDLDQILGLYRHLHPGDPALEPSEDLDGLWQSIRADPNIHLVVARSGDKVVSTCTLVLVPNLTRGARPYALIENVVTHPNHQRKGIGTAVVRHGLGLAWDRGCYKVMLLTSSTSESTWRFYERAGFLRGIKTGFIAYPGTG